MTSSAYGGNDNFVLVFLVSFPCPSSMCWPFTTEETSQTRTGIETVNFLLKFSSHILPSHLVCSCFLQCSHLLCLVHLLDAHLLCHRTYLSTCLPVVPVFLPFGSFSLISFFGVFFCYRPDVFLVLIVIFNVINEGPELLWDPHGKVCTLQCLQHQVKRHPN